MTDNAYAPLLGDAAFADRLGDFLSTFGVIGTELIRVELAFSTEVSFDRDPDFRFGAVIEGSFSMWLDGESQPVCLRAGDSFVLSGTRPGRSFTGMNGSTSHYSITCRDIVSLAETEGGRAEPAVVVLGGRLVLDREAAVWLREALPPLIHVTSDAAQAKPLSTVITLLRSESEIRALGRQAIATRLADILLVQTIRAYLDENSGATNWLAGLADRQIGRAIQNFHADIAGDWTVASLARAAGMSRSSFAKRFRDRTGLSPMEYVNRWRMHRVRRELLETSLPFATISYRNGYLSRTACSQAFKQTFGVSPGQFRSQQSRTCPDEHHQSRLSVPEPLIRSRLDFAQ